MNLTEQACARGSVPPMRVLPFLGLSISVRGKGALIRYNFLDPPPWQQQSWDVCDKCTGATVLSYNFSHPHNFKNYLEGRRSWLCFSCRACMQNGWVPRNQSAKFNIRVFNATARISCFSTSSTLLSGNFVQAAGELFGHYQSKSQCFQVQPVTCCVIFRFSLLLWGIFYRFFLND